MDGWSGHIDMLRLSAWSGDTDTALKLCWSMFDQLRNVIADQQRRIAELEARLRDADAGEANEPEDAATQLITFGDGSQATVAEMVDYISDIMAADNFRPTPVDDPNDPARRRR